MTVAQFTGSSPTDHVNQLGMTLLAAGWEVADEDFLSNDGTVTNRVYRCPVAGNETGADFFLAITRLTNETGSPTYYFPERYDPATKIATRMPRGGGWSTQFTPPDYASAPGYNFLTKGQVNQDQNTVRTVPVSATSAITLHATPKYMLFGSTNVNFFWGRFEPFSDHAAENGLAYIDTGTCAFTRMPGELQSHQNAGGGTLIALGRLGSDALLGRPRAARVLVTDSQSTRGTLDNIIRITGLTVSELDRADVEIDGLAVTYVKVGGFFVAEDTL